MNKTTPFTYEGHDVRVLNVDGDPWFVLTDICRVLGLSQPHRVAALISKDARASSAVTDSLGRQQLTIIVPEAGMYEVVIRSDKPQAAAFRRWITHEVLPSIRRTGTYSVADQQREHQSSPGAPPKEACHDSPR